MIAFVRSVTSAGISAGSMLRSPSRTSQKTGVAPQCSITFAVAGQVIGLVITSSPGPTPTREQREVERGRARGDREHVLGLEVGGHPLLEQRGPRAGRQPARAQRLDDGGDLLLPDRGRLEAEPGATRGAHRPGSVRSAPHGEPARGRRRGRRRWRGSRRPGRRRAGAARSASRAAGRSAPTRRPRRASASSTPSVARSTPSGATRKRTHAPPTRTARTPIACDTLSQGFSPSAKETARSLRSTPERGAAELGVVAAAEAGRDLDHVGPAVGAEPDLGVARPVLDPERRDGGRAPPRSPPPSRARSARRGRARRRTRAARRGSCRSP